MEAATATMAFIGPPGGRFVLDGGLSAYTAAGLAFEIGSATLALGLLGRDRVPTP